MRLERRAKLRDAIDRGHAGHRQGRRRLQARRLLRQRALNLIISGRAREAFDLQAETASDPRPLRPQHLRPKLPAGPAAGRGRHAGRRGHLAQGRQLRQPLVGPPRRPDQADEEPVGPDARRRAFGACSTDLDERGLLDRHAGRGGRRIRPQPAEGRQHLGQRQQRRRPRPLALLLHRGHGRRRHQARLRPRQVRQDRLAPRSKTRSTRASCWRRSITPSASTRTRSSTTT